LTSVTWSSTNSLCRRSVGAIEPKFYGEFVAGLGLDISELPPPLDKHKWPELKTTFAEAFAQNTRDEWTEVFSARDACVTPVLSMDEAQEHEHNRERNGFLNVAGTVRPNVAPRFEGIELNADAEVCLSGSATREILGELRYEDNRIAELLDRGVVAVAD